MRISRLFILLVFALAGFRTFGQAPFSSWVPPLDIPLAFSGTFGEIRGSHFHAGVDLKTKGREGFPVRAVSKGSIVRVRVSLSGYGKSLYIEHPNGTTTVYAHLKKLAPPFEKLLKEVQYQNESYTVQFYPKGDSWKVETGMVIGYSGNTGGSLGPHLHFEVRDTRTQELLNPLNFGIQTPDKLRPIVQNLWVQKVGTLEPKPIVLEKVNDSLWSAPRQSLGGLHGFLIRMFDRQDRSYNKNGVYQLELRVNGSLLSRFQLDRMSFGDSKKIKELIDYRLYRLQRKTFLKLYDPQSISATFMEHKSLSLFNFEDGNSYKVDLKISDHSANHTYISFFVEGTYERPSTPVLPSHIPEKDYRYASKNSSIYIPKNSFYSPVQTSFEAKADTLFVSQDSIPLNKGIDLRFDFPQTAANSNTYCIAKLNRKGSLDFVSASVKEQQLAAKVSQLGTFVRTQDSLAPEIRPLNFKDQQWVSRYQYLTLKIQDDFSGVNTYEGRINGQWVLFEYEPKTKTLTYDFSDRAFPDGKHELEVTVSDRCQNKAVYKTQFFRKYGLN